MIFTYHWHSRNNSIIEKNSYFERLGIFKDTPLLSTIGVAELFHAATAVGGYHYRYLEPYTIVGLIFLTLSIPAAMWIRKVEKNVNLAQGKIKKEQL